MAFLTEPEPKRGVALPVLPGIRRIVAPNASAMTYHGTNTYLIDGPDGTVVLDPGPADAGHVQAIQQATGDRVAMILVSHTHRDHVGAVDALKRVTGAPTVGFAGFADDTFVPDIGVGDNDVVAGLAVLHTPGHAADHLCFAMAAADGRRLLFSADHVMSWSSSIVSPPGGSMVDYFANLRRLLERDDDVFLPGHGPPLPQPRTLVRDLLSHRMAREEAIEQAIGTRPADSKEITRTLYAKANPLLLLAAERNVLGHLLKLEAEGRVTRAGPLWRRAG